MTIRILTLLIWAGVIFITTCVSNLSELTQGYFISFDFRDKPDLTEFYFPLPILTEDFMIQKIGHILAFFILTILLFQCFYSFSIAFIGSTGYAFMTEILQLYFSRGGRLFDVGFDSIGVIAGLLFSVVVLKRDRHESRVQVQNGDSL